MKNPIISYNPNLKELARKLRKEGTLAEILIWKQIQKKQLRVEFHRQVPILNYIVDFYCHEIKLAIEIDRIRHNYDEIKANDEERQDLLESHGISFLRFDDRLVRGDITDVIREIEQKIEELKS